MKTADQRELKLQMFALNKLGFSPKAAAGMVAKGYQARQRRLERAEILKVAAKKPAVTHLLRLRKSLPPIDDPLPTAPNRDIGEWSQKTDAINAKGKVALSDKLDQLLEAAKAAPEKLSPETLERLNKYLASKGQEPITKALPFGQSVLAATMTANKFNQLSGHQQSALKAGLDPATPGIESMSFPQMQAVAEQQQLEQVNKQRGLYGMPPLEPDQTKQQSVCYLDFK